MSLAGVFTFLFETKGSDKLKKDVKEIEKGLKDTEQNTKNLTRSNNELLSSVTRLYASYLGFKKILTEVFGYASGGEQLLLLSRNAGIGAEQLQKYGVALANYGGNLSSVSATLSHLNQQMQDLKFGKGGALQEASLRYGLDISGANGLATGEELLFNIAKRMQGLNQTEQLDFGRKLGLDPATITWLQTGLDNITKDLEKASKLTLYSPEDIENSRKFQISLRELNLSIQKIWASLSRFLMPIFTAIFDIGKSIFSYLAEHKGFILGFFGALGVALGVVAVATGVITGQFLFWAGVIAGVSALIGLLVDDIITFMEGGDSFIGFLIDNFMDFVKFLEKIGSTISNIFIKAFEDLGQSLIEPFIALGKFFNEFFDNLGKKILSSIIGVFDFIIEKWNKLKSWIPFINKDTNIIKQGQLSIDSTRTPLSTISTNGNTVNSNKSVKIDEVIVNTQATDSVGISMGISGALSDEFEKLMYQNTSGAMI